MSREALMLCPNCYLPGERYKSPKEVPGLGVMRRHKCRNCRRVFLSLQKVVTGKYAEVVLNRIEAAEEAARGDTGQDLDEA
jgi:transcriptional regulator NrdR family protein